MAGSGNCDWTICPEVISGRKVAHATLDPRLLRCGILAVAARRSAWPAIPRLVDPSACPSWRRPLCRKQTTSAKSRTSMSRVHNFAAGPATLPESVLRQAQEEMLDWHGVGASIVELSHRGPEFIQVATEAEADLRRLMSIPDDYAVLFLGGGATTVQALLPLNFADAGQAADYALSGHWGKTAVKQAKPYVSVNIAASSEAEGFRTVPAASTWQLSKDAAYVHVTANETIHGVEFRDAHYPTPEQLGDVPLVADFSSSIASE